MTTMPSLRLVIALLCAARMQGASSAMLAGVEQVGDIDGGSARARARGYRPMRAVPRHFGAVAGESVAHVFILDGEYAVLASGAERHVETDSIFSCFALRPG